MFQLIKEVDFYGFQSARAQVVGEQNNVGSRQATPGVLVILVIGVNARSVYVSNPSMG